MPKVGGEDRGTRYKARLDMGFLRGNGFEILGMRRRM